jgi:IS605 OrfB family transposase
VILTRTIKVKIEASIEALLPTISAYTTAYNHVCRTGWNDSDCNGISLHHKTYQRCKTWLPSQLSISARTKAAESLKSVRARRRKGLPVSCPHSKQCFIRYDSNSYNVWSDKNILSLSTSSGRQKFGFKSPPNINQYKDWRRKSAELFIRGKKVFLGIVFEKEVTDPKPTQQTVGVDRGIKKIAVTSDNQFFGGGHVKKVVQRYRSLRKKLQSKGTRSAKRHLQKINKKENRFRRDVNHRVSKKIVSPLSPGTTIVLEDLKNIRDNSKKFRKEQKYWINGWSFFQLESFLTYKALEKGCFVDFVDARYTSQKCSVCGHIKKSNRAKQSLFRCKHCGFSLNADLNAARNIRNNYMDAKGYPCRAAVNQPIVTSSHNSVTSPRL